MFDLLTIDKIQIKTYIAGVSYENRDEHIRKLTLSSSIKIVPDFKNPHHNNAFKVIAAINEEEVVLGYLPRELANRMRNFVDHGHEIKQAYVRKIYYDKGEKGQYGYYPSVDIEFEVKLNKQEVDKEMPVEKIEMKQGSMKIIELDQQRLQTILKSRLTYLQEVIDYNEQMYSRALFNDYVDYPLSHYWGTEEEVLEHWSKQNDLKLEEGEVIKIREGLLHILLEKIDLNVRKSGNSYLVSLSFYNREHIGEVIGYLRDLSEMDADRAEVFMELLNEDSKNDFDLGYYNQNRGSEFYEAFDVDFCMYEDGEELDKEIESCIQSFKENSDDLDEDELTNYKDYVDSVVDELVIKLPSGRFALIFYSYLEEALDY